ncbi:MAG: MarR family transcriptional regulator [Acidimicrobiales bacterium]|nr:MarR family transcriptional regulator [Acidimicrobiales bacterium]MCB9393629.1 MarR family transcriptional regulator [Acidimicrobiaceae bacterium]
MARPRAMASEATEARSSDDDLLWSRMMTLFVTARDQMFGILVRHELTPPHGFALSMLQDGQMRMRDMAERMSCDASYITAVVDRLEEVGLAERRSSPTDRRVKEIALTDAGERVAALVRRTLTAPPPAIERLTTAERRTLAALLAKMVPEDEIADDAFRIPPPRV